MAARIAFIDLETAPNLGYVWGIWDQNVIDIKDNWYILSFAVKWGDGRVKTRAPPADQVAEGLLVMRVDGALIFVVWEKDGTCGHAILPPHLIDQLMRAIEGTES